MSVPSDNWYVKHFNKAKCLPKYTFLTCLHISLKISMSPVPTTRPTQGARRTVWEPLSCGKVPLRVVNRFNRQIFCTPNCAQSNLLLACVSCTEDLFGAFVSDRWLLGFVGGRGRERETERGSTQMRRSCKSSHCWPLLSSRFEPSASGPWSSDGPQHPALLCTCVSLTSPTCYLRTFSINFTEQIPSWHAYSRSASTRNPPLMQYEGLFPSSQEPATGLCSS
jgi:hypothetical protein